MTDTDLPPYSGGQATCAKCRAIGASTEYSATIPHLTNSGDRITYGMPTGGDGLIRCCERCGWVWLEACTDTAPDDSLPHVDRPDWVLRLWRDWPQERRDTVRNLSHHLADAIEALDPAKPCAYCAAIRTADDACSDTQPSWTQGGGRDATP